MCALCVCVCLWRAKIFHKTYQFPHREWHREFGEDSRHSKSCAPLSFHTQTHTDTRGLPYCYAKRMNIESKKKNKLRREKKRCKTHFERRMPSILLSWHFINSLVFIVQTKTVCDSNEQVKYFAGFRKYAFGIFQLRGIGKCLRTN